MEMGLSRWQTPPDSSISVVHHRDFNMKEGENESSGNQKAKFTTFEMGEQAHTKEWEVLPESTK